MFLSDARKPKVSFFKYICLDAPKFVLPRVLTLKETIWPTICSKSRTKSAETPLPVHVRELQPMQLTNLPKKETLDKVRQPMTKLLTDRFCKQNKQILRIRAIIFLTITATTIVRLRYLFSTSSLHVKP